MNPTGTILNAIIPVFGVMALGMVIRRRNWLTEAADRSLMQICVNVLLPCLILDKSFGNPALSEASNLLLAPLLGYLLVAFGVWLAWLLRPHRALATAAASRTFAVTVGTHNYSYVPLPLALLLFDGKTVGVLFLHIIGAELAMWSVGVMVLSGGALRDWRKLLNAPLFAILIAIVSNAVGADRHVPAVLSTGIHWLGGCAIPLALLLIGAIMADRLPEFVSRQGGRVIGAGAWLRLGLLPLSFLLAAKLIPLTVEHQRVLVLEAAMPCAVFPMVLSKLYPGEPLVAIRTVLSTAVISLITTPLWIRLGLKWLAL
ncbi:MAG: AEC family transporter [Verrucomicrobiae bacterium]|nr:AEC family transporter [Verrucomicrobiae bacterium]